uniref:Uncharacterized protein n=1 Tax=Sphaerodactylus townsendi TaxID=933632 RepID=A0ACB8EFG1_9SAUR
MDYCCHGDNQTPLSQPSSPQARRVWKHPRNKVPSLSPASMFPACSNQTLPSQPSLSQLARLNWSFLGVWDIGSPSMALRTHSTARESSLLGTDPKFTNLSDSMSYHITGSG